MKESLQNAKQELKRVDHQIFVSLKYTRTVDVLMLTLGKMIDVYECFVDCLLKKAVEEKRIREEYIPMTPIEKGNMTRDLYKDEIVQHNLDLYFLLRKVVKTNPKKEQEFRRHVTLRTFVDGNEIAVDIDQVAEYYEILKQFLAWVEQRVGQGETD